MNTANSVRNLYEIKIINIIYNCRERFSKLRDGLQKYPNAQISDFSRTFG